MTDIGTNAGKIWRILKNEKTGLTLNELYAKTRLNFFENATALGWLAREGKLRFTQQEGKKDYRVQLSE